MPYWIKTKKHKWLKIFKKCKILGIRTRIIYDFLVLIQGSYMISLVSYKDRTKKSGMDSMKSYKIIVWNQRNFNPGSRYSWAQRSKWNHFHLPSLVESNTGENHGTRPPLIRLRYDRIHIGALNQTQQRLKLWPDSRALETNFLSDPPPSMLETVSDETQLS